MEWPKNGPKFGEELCGRKLDRKWAKKEGQKNSRMRKSNKPKPKWNGVKGKKWKLADGMDDQPKIKLKILINLI